MSTVVLTNAVILYGGSNFSADQNEVTVEYSAEMLDTTVFGDDTRKNTGGLKDATISGTGFWSGGSQNADDILFGLVGSDVEPLTVFGDGITEGQTGGYSMKAVIENYNIGSMVGSMLTFDLTARTRGVQ